MSKPLAVDSVTCLFFCWCLLQNSSQSLLGLFLLGARERIPAASAPMLTPNGEAPTTLLTARVPKADLSDCLFRCMYILYVTEFCSSPPTVDLSLHRQTSQCVQDGLQRSSGSASTPSGLSALPKPPASTLSRLESHIPPRLLQFRVL